MQSDRGRQDKDRSQDVFDAARQTSDGQKSFTSNNTSDHDSEYDNGSLERILEKVTDWQDEATSHLAELKLLKPVHDAIQCMRLEMDALREDFSMRSSKLSMERLASVDSQATWMSSFASMGSSGSIVPLASMTSTGSMESAAQEPCISTNSRVRQPFIIGPTNYQAEHTLAGVGGPSASLPERSPAFASGPLSEQSPSLVSTDDAHVADVPPARQIVLGGSAQHSSHMPADDRVQPAQIQLSSALSPLPSPLLPEVSAEPGVEGGTVQRMDSKTSGTSAEMMDSESRKDHELMDSEGRKGLESGLRLSMSGTASDSELGGLRLSAMGDIEQELGENSVESSGTCHFHPDSSYHLFWDLCSVFVLGFDAFTIPIMISWSPKSEGVLLIGMWLTALYWTFDVIVNLRTAYFTKIGELEKRPSRIFMRYLKSTMLFDTFVCVADWVGIALDLHQQSVNPGVADSDRGQAIALLRIIKINRVFRMMRVVRVTKLWREFRVFFSSAAQMACQVVALFLFIVWLNHLFSCIWYLLGTDGKNSDTGFGWLDGQAIGADDEIMWNACAWFQYTTAYHWSVTQLTPGSMEVVPYNSMERVFNICILLFGLFFCTTLISRLSALMVQLQIANKDKADITWKLRSFLQQKSVSSGVARLVEDQVVQHLNTVRPLCMEDLPVLRYLSKPLRRELKISICSPDILQQSLFVTLDYVNNRATSAVCNSSELRMIESHQELFVDNVTTSISYLLVTGSMLYTESQQRKRRNTVRRNSNNKTHSVIEPMQWDSKDSKDIDASSRTFELQDRGKWISSAAFWMQWKTKGCMEARQHSEVIGLDSKTALPAILGSDPRVTSVTRHYRKQFFELWDAMGELEHKKINDIVDPVNHAMVIMNLPPFYRNMVYTPLLETIRRKNRLQWGSGEAINNLEDELNSGKCALIAAREGLIMRVAMVVALHVTRPGGEVLLEIATIKGDQCKITARPPGSKLRERETLTAAATRGLDALIKDIQGDQSFELEGWQYMVKECGASPTYGLQTEYHRNIFRVVQAIDTQSLPPQLSSNKPPQSGVDIDAVPQLIRAHLPSLACHYPDHLYIAQKPGEDKATIYAWVHPDDVNVFNWNELGVTSPS